MINARLSIDGKKTIDASVKGRVIEIDIIDYKKVLFTPLLVKIALGLKNASSGGYKVKIKESFFSKIFGKS